MKGTVAVLMLSLTAFSGCGGRSFDSASDAMNTWKKVADQFGGAGVVYGNDWAVECSVDQAGCDALKKAVG